MSIESQDRCESGELEKVNMGYRFPTKSFDGSQPLVLETLRNGLLLYLKHSSSAVESTEDGTLCDGKKDENDFDQMTSKNCTVAINREVLEAWCKALPAEDVATFRLVCKEWSQAGLKAWRKVAKLTVVEYQSEAPRKEGLKNMLKLLDLIDYIEDSNDPFTLNLTKKYHYQKYKLESWYLTNKNPNMVKFWNYLGSNICHLELSNMRIKKMDTILNVLYDKVPNMQTLILEKLFVLKTEAFVQESEQEAAIFAPQSKLKVLKVRNLCCFPVRWTEFFRHFPNIEILETVNIKTDNDLDLILSSILSMQRKETILPLKSLTISRGDSRHKCVQKELSFRTRANLMSCAQMMSLQECSFKLGCRTTIKIADDVLKCLPETVKKLTFHIDFKCLADRFPYGREFPNLEELELYQWCKPTVQMDMILQFMPNLKVLKVKGLPSLLRKKDIDSAIVTDIRDKKFNVCNGLEDLSVPLSNITPIKINMLSLLAPNLTKLELKMDNRIFTAVCVKYQNLVELRVKGTRLTDEGITGFLKSNTSRAVTARRANISYLKKLRNFIMHDLEHLLTSKSVFDGFLEVKSLFTLQMSLPPAQISPEARQALEENIPNLIVPKVTKKKPGNEGINKDKMKKI